MPDLKKMLRASNEGLIRQGRVGVVVSLGAPPGEGCLVRMQKLGLTINRVIGNKVLGSIDADRIRSLKEDAKVVEVELSVVLEPH